MNPIPKREQTKKDIIEVDHLHLQDIMVKTRIKMTESILYPKEKSPKKRSPGLENLQRSALSCLRMWVMYLGTG